MHEIEDGFRIDGRLIAWGTTLEGAATQAGIAFEGERNARYSRLRVRCGRAYGFDTLAAEMSSFGADRPVTSLAYALALPGNSLMDDDLWMSPLRHAFGTPERDQTEDIPEDGTAESRVRRYASWSLCDVTLGISIYGAPRREPEGRSAGTLWLSWSHTRAAVLYLPSWRSACAALAVAARGAEELGRFSLQVKPNALHLREGSGAEHMRACELALGAPDILETPEQVAASLGPKQFAIWRNPVQRIACLSTRRDSRMWDEGSRLEVVHQVTRPAKGGGLTGLHVGKLSVCDAYGSRAIEEATALLSTMPGVIVRRSEDYDC